MTLNIIFRTTNFSQSCSNCSQRYIITHSMLVMDIKTNICNPNYIKFRYIFFPNLFIIQQGTGTFPGLRYGLNLTPAWSRVNTWHISEVRNILANEWMHKFGVLWKFPLFSIFWMLISCLPKWIVNSVLTESVFYTLLPKVPNITLPLCTNSLSYFQSCILHSAPENSC